MPHGFITEDGGATWAKAEIGNAVNKIRLIKHEGKVIGYAIGTEVHKLIMPQLPPKQ